MTGVERIAAERELQRDVEGWDAEHDRGHAAQLSQAGATYALDPILSPVPRAAMWPWDPKWWKPTPSDRVRELEKAGALIAAAIDDLLLRPNR